MAAGRRILVAYLVYFSALGASFPYLPVFYRDLGLRLEEIGLLTAIQAATQLALAPVWGGLMDRFPKVGVTLPVAAAIAADESERYTLPAYRMPPSSTVHSHRTAPWRSRFWSAVPGAGSSVDDPG